MGYRIRVEHPNYTPTTILWQRPGLMGMSIDEPFSLGTVTLSAAPDVTINE
jgi:hypothetical protein